MNLREFKECVKFNIENGLRYAVLGLGAPGVGKSQVIKQIGDELGYKVIDLRLAQMSEVEIGGLIYPNEDRTKTRWLSPEVLPDEERDGGGRASAHPLPGHGGEPASDPGLTCAGTGIRLVRGHAGGRRGPPGPGQHAGGGGPPGQSPGRTEHQKRDLL